MIDPEIRAHLSREPRIAPIVAALEIPPRPNHGGDVYFGLLRSIAYQQLSGKAASTIFNRFLHLFPDSYPHPEQLLDLDDTAIRSAGMSRAKTAYLQNVAQYWLDHKLINADWSQWSDAEIIAMLTTIKGVGQWTVEMVLMFVLQRPDLLPLDDLIVRRNVIELFGIDTEKLKGRQLKAEILRVTEPWRPYRSYASRFLWAAKGTLL